MLSKRGNAKGGARSSYSAAFRAKAVRMVEEGRNRASVARELGIPYHLVHSWAQHVGVRKPKAKPRTPKNPAKTQEPERELLISVPDGVYKWLTARAMRGGKTNSAAATEALAAQMEADLPQRRQGDPR